MGDSDVSEGPCTYSDVQLLKASWQPDLQLNQERKILE